MSEVRLINAELLKREIEDYIKDAPNDEANKIFIEMMHSFCRMLDVMPTVTTICPHCGTKMVCERQGTDE